MREAVKEAEMTRSSNRRQRVRALVWIGGLVAAVVGPLAAMPAPATAHDCRRVEVWVAGGHTPVGDSSCTNENDPGWHTCNEKDGTVLGTGVKWWVCVHKRVMQ